MKHAAVAGDRRTTSWSHAVGSGLRRAGLASMVLLAALPVSLTAQDEAPPEGWMMRTDRGQGASEIYFVDMPPGWHVTSGPAAIYWNPDWTASGDYRVEMDVYLFDPGQRREAFGFFMGGANLEDRDQAYIYFLIRNGAEYIVKERAGSEAPTLVPWTANSAILGWADRGEDEATVFNRLAAEVDGDEIHFFVNDERVHTLSRGNLELDGVVGFRVNHGLNLHISRMEVVEGSTP